ncbi:MAG: putative toxin-antitoxin system toxin component, PIN family [Gemmatimonadales bacterium]|nr:putative toxin-antitoxin system toxin component, PIN family [Gemmatimonadales bacterium]
MKVCLDSNVLVSAFATRGLSADVLRIVLAEHELLVPEVVLAEVRKALEQKFRLPAQVVTGIEQLLRDQTVIPRPRKPSTVPVRDPDDAWVLASGIAGAADVLVTGDKDLLVVASKAPLPIESPRQFWERLRGQSGGT